MPHAYTGTDIGEIRTDYTLPNDGDVRKADSVNIVFEPVIDSLASIAFGHWTMSGIQTVDAGGTISLTNGSQLILASGSTAIVGSGCTFGTFSATVAHVHSTISESGCTVSADALTTFADASTTTLTGTYHVHTGGTWDIQSGGLGFVRSGGVLRVDDGGTLNVLGDLQVIGPDGLLQAGTGATIRIDDGGTFHVDGAGAAQMNGATTFNGAFGGSVAFSGGMPVSFVGGTIDLSLGCLMSLDNTCQIDYADTPITGSRVEQGRVKRSGAGAYQGLRIGRIAPLAAAIDAHAYDAIAFNAPIASSFDITLNDVPHGYNHQVRFWVFNGGGTGVGGNVVNLRDSAGALLAFFSANTWTFMAIDLIYDGTQTPRWDVTNRSFS